MGHYQRSPVILEGLGQYFIEYHKKLTIAQVIILNVFDFTFQFSVPNSGQCNVPYLRIS